MNTRSSQRRISLKISLPSAALQNFLRQVISDDAVYERFLEDTAGVLIAHGIELQGTVAPKILMDFRFAVDRARRAVREGGKHFEDVFGPVVPKPVGVDAAVDVYYSETTSSENRGTTTDFSSGMTPTKSTDRWSTKDFGGTSIFRHEFRKQRFQRVPMLSSEVLQSISKMVAASGV